MGLDTILRRRDWVVDMPDTANSSADDLSNVSVAEGYAASMRAGTYTAAGLAPVCTSLSAALQPRVRDDAHLWGFHPERLPLRLDGMSGAEYLRGHNAMLTGFFILLRGAAYAARELGMEFWVEQPADTLPEYMPDGVMPNPFHHYRGAPHGAPLPVPGVAGSSSRRRRRVSPGQAVPMGRAIAEAHVDICHAAARRSTR